MYVLDTDHLSILERGGSASVHLQMRLDNVPLGEVVTTIVTYEEQMRGWLARMPRMQTEAGFVTWYTRLQWHIDAFAPLTILPFNEEAAAISVQIFEARIRIGTMDRRIAAITMAHHAVLLSRNLSDFKRVPDLHVEDWSL